MKIIRIDEYTKAERTVARDLSEIDATKQAVRLAGEERDRIPNDPKLVQTGPGSVSVAIGVYKIVTYRIVPDK